MAKSANPSLGLMQRGLLALTLVGAGASLYFGVKAAWSDASSLQARWQVTQWQSGALSQPKVAELGQVRNALMLALRWTPDDPQIYENLGYLYGVRAANARAVPELEQALLDDSINYYRTATTMRPMSAYAWANLAFAEHLKGAAPALIWSAYDRAYRYGNREAGVQRILAEVGFSHWEEAGRGRQEQLVQLIDAAYPHAKGDLIKIAGRHDKAALLAGQ